MFGKLTDSMAIFYSKLLPEGTKLEIQTNPPSASASPGAMRAQTAFTTCSERPSGEVKQRSKEDAKIVSQVGDLMGFNGDWMGFHGDFMVIKWDVNPPLDIEKAVENQWFSIWKMIFK